MSAWQVKQGNTSIQVIEVKDKDDELVEDMGDCSSITFQVKERKSNSVKITRSVGVGSIVVDSPTTGYLTITLLPTETNIDYKKYVMALELVWGATVRYEARLYIDGNETYDFVIEKQTIE